VGNPGCHLQLANGLAARRMTSVRVEHPVTLLAAAYRAEAAGPTFPPEQRYRQGGPKPPCR
jgi:hypothetical protein